MLVFFLLLKTEDVVFTDRTQELELKHSEEN